MISLSHLFSRWRKNFRSASKSLRLARLAWSSSRWRTRRSNSVRGSCYLCPKKIQAIASKVQEMLRSMKIGSPKSWIFLFNRETSVKVWSHQLVKMTAVAITSLCFWTPIRIVSSILAAARLRNCLAVNYVTLRVTTWYKAIRRSGRGLARKVSQAVPILTIYPIVLALNSQGSLRWLESKTKTKSRI